VATESVSCVSEEFRALSLSLSLSLSPRSLSVEKEEILGCRNTRDLKTWENGGLAPHIVNHRTTTGDH
jgi:hypothetical protein